jgi:hypothetical protein
MKLYKFFSLSFFVLSILVLGTSCVKQGPPGLNGDKGDTGANGVDANETCKLCHNPTVVDAKAVEFQYAKHGFGEVFFEEGGNTGCSPCHTQLGFQSVVKNNTSTVFVKDAAGKYSNPYAADPTSDIGAIGCFTCHSQLHTTYGYTDFSPLTTTAAVPMTMWGGAKTINLTQDGGKSNLCIKCHQPRPFTNSATDGNVLDYNALKTNPTAVFYDAALTTNKLKPSYRTHTHYGTVGAIVAGMGGVEFTGTLTYANAVHATLASCSDCHQAAVLGKSGGHTFSAAGNFNGCNVAACHGANTVTTGSGKYWVNPRTTIKGLLDQLAAKLTIGGIDILNRNPDSASNLWFGLTSNNYDGYLNIYDPVNNPTGPDTNATLFQNPSPASSWTAAQKATNLTYPKITLTNAQMGALINFQLCLREFSLGIHNLDYSKALLTNSIAVLP